MQYYELSGRNMCQPLKLIGEKGNHLLFWIRGNNTSVSFRLRLTDLDGNCADYGVSGGNSDFLLTDTRPRRLIVDLEGDAPAADDGCDKSALVFAELLLASDPGGTVWASDVELFTRPSCSKAWQLRMEELVAENSQLLTQNEPASHIEMMDDIVELQQLLKRLKKENGPDCNGFIRAEGTQFVNSKTGERYTPIGANYLGINIWEPQIFRNFSPDEIDEDFAIMESLGYNTFRFAFTHHIWYAPGNENEVEESCMLKIEIILELARKHGIRAILVGLDGEPPERFAGDGQTSDEYIGILELRFESAARRLAGYSAIFAWNIFNELTVPWSTSEMAVKWKAWQRERGMEPVPVPDDAFGAPMLYEYQQFRVSCGTDYVRRITSAIRRGTQNQMVTCGTLQWSFPLMRPGDKPSSYAAADPQEFAEFVDFFCPHYYPLYSQDLFTPPENFHTNLQGLRGWIRYCKMGKPILLEEFGSPGGGEFWGREYTQNQQAQFSRAVVDTTAADVAGYINWPFQDTPPSTDISRWTGLVDVEKQPKAWGAECAAFIRSADQTPGDPETYQLDFESCTTESGVGGFANYIRENLNNYLEYIKNNDKDVKITK